MDAVLSILDAIDSVMYYPVLIIIMASAGIYFTVRTKGVQIRLFPEACRLVVEKPEGKNQVSSFQALMVSTASRVGTGNIIGVASAICLGGAGATFWMWVMCLIGASSAFMESTLAQIYKQKNDDGGCYGGPAYYIEKAMHAPWLSVLFCIFLIATYAVGFNLLCSYNLQSTFATYSFYNPDTTPMVVGSILALIVGYCLFGGGKRIVHLTSVIVPVMGVFYVIISLIVIFAHIPHIPVMFAAIFHDAFNFRAIFGGLAGSCMIYGFKRGLYSNEAGVGSAPNASASAEVSHPAKQGLVQTISVYIDTMLLCTATAFMCLSSGAEYGKNVEPATFVQNATSTVFGKAGPIIITVSMILFAFTTLIGNLYYVNNAMAYINHKKMPGKRVMYTFYLVACVVIFMGAIMPMNVCWDLADITMGCMTMINLPACVIMSNTAVKTLKDFEKQHKAGKNPVFRPKDIGLDASGLSYWK
ncbi:MAG: alanine/glycine:cation symporter family protein [Bilifractor sp.]|jgi:AGCS family alanine or glycine:cation symporter